MSKPDGPHWSASRFALFEQCPVAYRERYVDGIVSEPSLAMLFGHSVHSALEVLHQGQGGCCPVAEGNVDPYQAARLVYDNEFETLRADLEEVGIVAGLGLYANGLRLIDQVAELDLNSDQQSAPERWFKIPAPVAKLDAPIIGAVDLWSPPWSRHGAVVWDFKTTAGSWSQERAERERWQPLLYSWGYARAYGQVPTFKYLVLNRVTCDLTIFDRTWLSLKDWRADLADLQFHIEEIAEAVTAGQFDCSRGHGRCPECGEPFGHQHVCSTPSRHKVTLSKAAAS